MRFYFISLRYKIFYSFYPSVYWPGAGQPVKESEALWHGILEPQKRRCLGPFFIMWPQSEPQHWTITWGRRKSVLVNPWDLGVSVPAFSLPNTSPWRSGSHLSLQHHLICLWHRDALAMQDGLRPSHVCTSSWAVPSNWATLPSLPM